MLFVIEPIFTSTLPGVNLLIVPLCLDFSGPARCKMSLVCGRSAVWIVVFCWMEFSHQLDRRHPPTRCPNSAQQRESRTAVADKAHNSSLMLFFCAVNVCDYLVRLFFSCVFPDNKRTLIFTSLVESPHLISCGRWLSLRIRLVLHLFGPSLRGWFSL